jgi:hypothetical protein
MRWGREGESERKEREGKRGEGMGGEKCRGEGRGGEGRGERRGVEANWTTFLTLFSRLMLFKIL